MTNTTPGPWTQDEYGFVLDTNGRTVVVEGLALGSRSTDQSRANARLIAAAPDLLGAHEPEREGPDFLDWVADRLVNVYGESENVDFVICLRRRAAKARTAIAKAKGEQQ